MWRLIQNDQIPAEVANEPITLHPDMIPDELADIGEIVEHDLHHIYVTFGKQLFHHEKSLQRYEDDTKKLG